MNVKKIFSKTFLSTTATAVSIAIFTAGCPDELAIGEKKSGEKTPPALAEKAKTAGTDVNGKPVALTMDGKNVTGIVQSSVVSEMQKSKDALVKVVIPDGVEKIKDNKIYLYGDSGAFGSCHNLKSVTIPSSVNEIGEGSFHHCEKLSDLKIPDSVTTIGPKAFFMCESLALNVPANVSDVGEGAFVKLKDLQIASGNNTLKCLKDGSVVNTKTDALVYVKPNTSNIRIEGVRRIGDFTFANHSLNEVYIGDSVEEVGKNIFEKCEIGSVSFSNGRKKLFNSLFANSHVKKVTLPSSLQYINEKAFYNCDDLKEIKIPASVQRIGEKAFMDCHNLKKISVPEGVKVIENAAFYSNELTLEIPASVSVFDVTTCKAKAIKFHPGNKLYKNGKYGEVIHIPAKRLVFVPKNVSGEFTIPQEVTSVAPSVFRDCNLITTIVLHKNVSVVAKELPPNSKIVIK